MILVRGGRPTKFEVAYHPEKVDVKIVPDDTPTQKGRYKMTVTVPPERRPGPWTKISSSRPITPRPAS